MPYVEVWVDKEPCYGTCDEAKEAEILARKIEEAVIHLRQGYVDAALQALTEDPAIPLKQPDAIARAYGQWKEGRLAGFTNYRFDPP